MSLLYENMDNNLKIIIFSKIRLIKNVIEDIVYDNII